MNSAVAVASRRRSKRSDNVASAAGVSPASPIATPIRAAIIAAKEPASPHDIVITLHAATLALITRERRVRSASQASG